MAVCRLCAHEASPFMTVDGAAYWACQHCGLRFMAAENLPSSNQEKAHYDLHENNIDDQGYQGFLNQLAEPLTVLLPNPSALLDYGAGPGPALAVMMRNKGHDVTLYDPFYAPKPSVLKQQYDAVMATEVIEHFHHPRRDFNTMIACVRPGGYLAVMTNLQDDDDAFKNWYYRRDPTHVAFYREETFEYLARNDGLVLMRPSRNVAIFQKPD